MWKEFGRRGKDFCGWENHPHTNRQHTEWNKLWGRPLRGIMLADSATGWHRETPKHLAHIMRQGRSIGASWGGGGGGAIGICQSSWSLQRMSWTPLSPSVCEGWQLHTEVDMHSSTALYLAGGINYHKADTDNTDKPCSTDEGQTLMKSVCTCSVRWWSLRSSWQVTTCIRFKEDLRQRF